MRNDAKFVYSCVESQMCELKYGLNRNSDEELSDQLEPLWSLILEPSGSPQYYEEEEEELVFL
jgi:hypothetical protein